MELLEKALEFTGEPGLFEGEPQCGTVDGIVGLSKISEACVRWSIEFSGVVLKVKS
jgi:hypothetical protein